MPYSERDGIKVSEEMVGIRLSAGANTSFNRERSFSMMGEEG